MSTSSTAQYGARPGGDGVAGTLVGVGLAVGDTVAGGGDGVAVGAVVVLGLGGATVVAGDGVGVAETSGGAHVSTSDAATAMRRGAVIARRVLSWPTGMRQG